MPVTYCFQMCEIFVRDFHWTEKSFFAFPVLFFDATRSRLVSSRLHIRTVKMACLSVTNALMAQRAAVRTNKRCVHVPGTINPPANFHVFRDAATGDG
jgi:hypothetical protein